MTEQRSRPALITAVFGLLAVGIALADSGANHRVRTTSFGSSGGNVNYISSAYCCSGTLGALLAASDGTRYVLSNNHVLGLSGQARLGDDVSQPGLIDNGCRPGALVADFSAAPALRVSNVDAAVAAARPGMMDANGTILDIGVPSSSVRAPSVSLAVAKSGRTTGFTTGSISAIDATVKVQYQESCGQGRKFMIRFTNQIMIERAGFSAGGDSGSLIVTSDTSHQPVGLLFAGSSTITVANPIGEVLARLSAALGRSLSFNLPAASNFTSTQTSSLPEEEVARGTLAKEAHGRRLLGDPAVVAVGVGEEPGGAGRAAVIVYVARGHGRGRIPPRIDDVAVRVVQTDPIVAFGWNEVRGQSCMVR